MKKRVGKLLAGFLMFTVVLTSVAALPVQAKEINNRAVTEEKKVIEIAEKAQDSICLKAEEGYVYAIKMKDEKDPSKDTWKWAEETQYDKDTKTVKFEGLTAGTEYEFARAVEKTQTPQEIEKISTEAISTEPTSEEPENTEPTSEGPENTEPTSEGPENTEPTSEGPENTEPTSEGPENTEPTSEGPESTEPESTETTNTEPQALSAPEAPAVKLITDTEVQLEIIDGLEYAVSIGGIIGNWNSEGKFTGLTPETEYSFVARKKASGNQSASDASGATKVVTKAAAAEAPAKPEVESRTDTEIRLKAVQGQEYAALSKEKAVVEWNDTGVFSNLTPATEYTFVTRMKYNPDTAVESKQSEVLNLKTKNVAAVAPSAPDWSERSEVSIVLAEAQNQEYAIKQADGSWAWQASPEFTGLNPNTEYTFATRVIFNPDEAMESNISGESKFKTLIPFEGSTITGIAADGSYVSGTRLTATAVGNGMDNVNPSLWDTRWVPLRWNWGQNAFSDWKEPGYSIPFTLVHVGNYRLSVDFVLEEYTENGWTATDVINTATVCFKTTEAPATEFTISATAGANGRINPKGNLTVGKGKDYEFNFLPNEGYVVAKVYIDGVETKVENNKYTFKGVDANHTISVTFEQAKKLGFSEDRRSCNDEAGSAPYDSVGRLVDWDFCVSTEKS